MKTTAFSAMGTTWWIAAGAGHQRAELLVRAVERRLSRFLPDSALSRLNRDREVRDDLVAHLTTLALAAMRDTHGAFDPRLGHALRAAGYDRPFILMDAVVTPTAVASGPSTLQVEVDGDRVRLHGPGQLDLGGITKGWTVDAVFDQLEGPCFVDGGGDLRARGPGWTVGVGDEHAVPLDGAALATSSTRHRRWRTPEGEAHHLLDPRTGRPSRSPIAQATVRAATATQADILAKAVLLDPDRILPLLPTFGARALIQDQAGAWWNATPPLLEIAP